MVPGQLEGALAVARAALDAREFATARAALEPYVSAPTRRVATLMAEIEDAEHGDTGRVREWMARAMRASGDPVWTADGVVSDRWLPVSPNGRLDGFQWRVPLAEIGVSRPVVEVTLPPAPPPPEPEAEPQEPAEPAEIAAPEATAQPAAEPEAEAETKPEPEPQSEPEARIRARAGGRGPRKARRAGYRPPPRRPARQAKPAEPVIPLVHAPDDPGPEGGADAETGEPVPQPAEPRDAWSRFRQLFR